MDVQHIERIPEIEDPRFEKLFLEHRERCQQKTEEAVREFAQEMRDGLIETRGCVPPNLNMFNLGCGYGESPAMFAEVFPEVEVYGFDISAGAIEKANAQYHMSNLHFKVQDIYSFGEQFPDSATLVIGENILHHLDDLEGALKQVHTALKPGEVCIFDDFDRSSLLTDETIIKMPDGSFVPIGLGLYILRKTLTDEKFVDVFFNHQFFYSGDKQDNLACLLGKNSVMAAYTADELKEGVLATGFKSAAIIHLGKDKKYIRLYGVK